MTNPFQIGVLARGEHLADREEELRRVETALRDAGSKLVVYGPRRLGKSSVLHEAAHRVRAGGDRAVVVSLATASSPEEAAQRVLAAVQPHLERSWTEVVEEVTRRLRVTVELRADPLTGEPRVRLSMGRGSASPGPEGGADRLLPGVLASVNARLDAADETLGLALDEFQRIHAWGGEDAEWALREAIQEHRAMAYVFAGSQASLIEAMVSGRERALWKQVDILPMGPIDDRLLARWIWQRFQAEGSRIGRAAAERVVALARPRTRDVVQLARAVWTGPGEEVAYPETVDAAFEGLVRDHGALHERVWRGLSSLEQDILRVFAAAPRTATVRITAAETLDRFDLGPKSTVMNAVNRLVDDELLVRTLEGYAFDDPYVRRWIQHTALPDLGVSVPALTPARPPEG
jgi:hypothetical protein